MFSVYVRVLFLCKISTGTPLTVPFQMTDAVLSRNSPSMNGTAGAPRILKIQWFPLSILIFGQKSCFLGPTIFKIPQPN